MNEKISMHVDYLGNIATSPRIDCLPKDVEHVIINDKAVVVTLTDGRRGVAKCQENDEFDPYVGFVLAYYKSKNNKNYKLKETLERFINNTNKKGYKQTVMKNFDDNVRND